jgi:hypothetical protein
MAKAFCLWSSVSWNVRGRALLTGYHAYHSSNERSKGSRSRNPPAFAAIKRLCFAVSMPKRLSRETAPRPLLRPPNPQGSGVPDQQLYLTGFDHRSTLSLPLAGGAVLQVDQATPTDQSLLWHQRQCRHNTNLDRRLGLRLGGHRQKTIESRSQLVLGSTNLERDYLAENSNLTSTFTNR